MRLSEGFPRIQKIHNMTHLEALSVLYLFEVSHTLVSFCIISELVEHCWTWLNCHMPFRRMHMRQRCHPKKDGFDEKTKATHQMNQRIPGAVWCSYGKCMAGTVPSQGSSEKSETSSCRSQPTTILAQSHAIDMQPAKRTAWHALIAAQDSQTATPFGRSAFTTWWSDLQGAGLSG